MSEKSRRTGLSGPRARVITEPQLKPNAKLGEVWRERANWAVRGIGPPTVPIALPGTDDDVSQQHARAVLDLALRIGEAALSTGASAADVVTTVLRVTSAYGVKSTSVDITYTSISVSMQRGIYEDPLSVMRVIKLRSMDFTRLEGLQLLVDDLCGSPEDWRSQRRSSSTRPRTTIDVEAARSRLSDVLTAPHPYRRWVVTLGMALTAVGVVILFGGDPVMWVVAGTSAALVDRAQRVLYGYGVASFFSQAVSAAIPSLIAVALFWVQSAGDGAQGRRGLGIDLPGVGAPSLVVVSGIIVLLAGLSVMGAAQDAIDGYYVTAGARGLEVVMMTLGIAVGVAVVLSVARSVGITMSISPYVDDGGFGVLLPSTIGAMVVAVGFCLTHYTRPRATFIAAGLAATAWLVFQAASLLNLGQAAASGVGAAVVGALAYTVHVRLRAPELVISTAAIVALLPGLAVYRAIFLLMTNPEELATAAIVQMITAIAVGLGLAAGLSIGSYIARRRFGLDRAALRARRRAMGSYTA
ncbi:MAG: threonine/serine exporter family protein [Ornithinimicrobium sp.]